MILLDYSLSQILLVGLLFIWTGFVRTGLGFGGAALGLPLLLFIDDRPLIWLPIIGMHLLFFSALTLSKRLHDVDWRYLKQSSAYILPAAIIGVLGLISLPNQLLVIFIYSITLFYAITWLFNWSIHSDSPFIDKLLLTFGGYVAGTSLTGAPLIVAVYMRNIAMAQLRNTLFVLWFILVTIKMFTFVLLDIDLHILSALSLLPVAAIGHILGLKVHDAILQNDQTFKRVIGGILMLICVLGFFIHLT